MKDRIKAVLDKECKSSGQCRGEYHHVIDGSGLPCRMRVQCWQCHKNDELSQKIADSLAARIAEVKE